MRSVLVAALALLGGGTRAMAAITIDAPFQIGDHIQATLTANSSLMGGGTKLNLNGDYVPHVGLTSREETYSLSQGGLLGWTDVYKNGVLQSGLTFNTTSAEVLQNVNWGQQATWVIGNLADAHMPGMGPNGAGLIQSLYNQYGSIAGDSSLNAGAFQLAIWKIEYDSLTQGPGKAINFNVWIGALKTMNTLETSLAQIWLDSLTVAPITNVYALISDGSGSGSSDQAIGLVYIPAASPQAVLVPEPASLIIWTLLAGGFASLAIVRKTRHQSGARRSLEDAR